MVTIPKNEYLNLIIRIVVGGIFIFTGLGKITNVPLFVREISNYDMLPYQVINVFAIILPWVELFAGVLFVFGIRIKANIILISSMLLMFNFAVAVAWIRGLDISCGCFSTMATQKVGITKLAENFAVLSALVFMYFFPNNKFSIDYFKSHLVVPDEPRP